VISAFVQWWQHETNTFHISFGEMTITLDDVSTLVGIPVMGRSVNIPQRMIDARGMLVSLVGVSPRDAQDELGLVCGTSIKLEWLRFKFSNVTDADSRRHIQCAARAYLLYFSHAFLIFWVAISIPQRQSRE